MPEVYVNARFLTQPMSGVQRFASEVCNEFRQRKLAVKFIAPANVADHHMAELLECELTGRMNGHLWEQIELPRLLKRRGKPLLLNLANTGPVGYKNSAVVLHDLAFLKHPEWFSRKFSTAYRWMIPKLLKHSRQVFTVSQFSAGEIATAWPFVASKMTIVGNGLATAFMNIADSQETSPEGPFVLAVTGNNQRKDPGVVIRAVGLLPEENRRLVLTGATSKNFSSISGQAKDRTNLPFLKWIERPTDDQLKSLYKKATVFVYPSLYEGFGLPPLEAMACGCPVILSDIPVFREIYNGAAHFVSAGNAVEVSEAILLLARDAQYRAQLVNAGRKLSETHTFSHVVDRMTTALNMTS